MAIGVIATAAVLAGGVTWGAPAPIVDRLGMAMSATAMLAIWLALAIATVARLRFASSVAIDGGGGDARVDRANAILRNTVEQAVLAALAYATLAWRVDWSRLLIESDAVLFSIGRLLFWAGYARGAPSRAAGFAITFYPTVAALLVAITG